MCKSALCFYSHTLGTQGVKWFYDYMYEICIYLLYSTYYKKPMGDLPYISSEQGGGLIYDYTYSRTELKRGVGL